MTRPTSDERAAMDALVGPLHDHGRIVGIDMSSIRVLFTLKDGATLRVGWRPVGLEVEVFEPGEDPEAGVSCAHEIDDSPRTGNATIDMLRSPPIAGDPHEAEPFASCGHCPHARAAHRQRGPSAPAYCDGGGPDDICPCPGWEAEHHA